MDTETTLLLVILGAAIFYKVYWQPQRTSLARTANSLLNGKPKTATEYVKQNFVDIDTV